MINLIRNHLVRRRINEMFGRYFAPALVNRVTASGENPAAGPANSRLSSRVVRQCRLVLRGRVKLLRPPPLTHIFRRLPNERTNPIYGISWAMTWAMFVFS